jgi:NAD-dependent dihydropyrimidine dehydrogenase PreA subunit
MTNDWYPIIDNNKCKDNCFKCLNFCPQKVFNKNLSKVKVIEPNKCLKDCNSCEELCPTKSISFIKSRTIEINGIKVGINGLDNALTKNNFESAFKFIQKHNYIPTNAIEDYKKTLKNLYNNQ